MSSGRAGRVSGSIVTFCPEPDPEQPLRDATELMRQVTDGRRKVKLVFGNGVSRLPVLKPREIVSGLRRLLHNRREHLKQLVSGEFQSKVNDGKYGDDVVADINRFLFKELGKGAVQAVERAVRENRALSTRLAGRVGNQAKEIEEQCLVLGHESPQFLGRLWDEYEQARFLSKRRPPAVFVLLSLLIEGGYVDCIVTPNYDCYLSSVLDRLEVTHAQNPCLHDSSEWSYDTFLSVRPKDPGILRVWKVFGDFDFARYSCGHIVKLPTMRLGPPPVDPSKAWIRDVSENIKDTHKRIRATAASHSGAVVPYCDPEDHDPSFYEDDPWRAYQPLHLVDFNWPARHRVFGQVIDGARQDLAAEQAKSLILVLGYSGNDDPIAGEILKLAQNVPVVHIMASSTKRKHLTGITSRLWEGLGTRAHGFRFLDDMTSRRTERNDKVQLMKPCRTLLEGADLCSLQDLESMEKRLHKLWRE